MNLDSLHQAYGHFQGGRLDEADECCRLVLKANPDKGVVFLLEQTNKFPSLTWRVIWGESVGTSNYSVFVDASSGEYLETMR